MKLFAMIVLLVSAAATFTVSSLARAEDSKKEQAGRLFHVVSFKFKEGTSKEDLKKVEDAFTELSKKVPGITSFSWGTNVSPEKRDKGFTHCFVLSFGSEKDRDAYLPHPEHKKFISIAGPFIEDVMVIDFVDQAGK